MPSRSASDPNLRALHALGWHPRSALPARTAVELAQAPTWTVARLWNTPARLESVPLRSGAQRVIVGIEGEASLHIDGVASRLDPGQLLLLDGAASVSTENAALWARLEWHLHAPALVHAPYAEHHAVPITLGADHRQLLATTANVISTSRSIADSPGRGVLLNALAGVVESAIIDSTGPPTALTPTQSVMFDVAMRLIDERYPDPGLSVAGIAQELSVSTNYLHRLFARMDTTPRREIESRRIATATTLLGVMPSRTRGALEGIAARSGFPSAKRMQIAIRRQRNRKESG